MRDRRTPLPLLLVALIVLLGVFTGSAGAQAQAPTSLPDPALALLTPADLPPGWTEGECDCGGLVRAIEDEVDERILMETCLGELETGVPLSDLGADIELARGPRGPVLEQEVSLYQPGETERLMAAARMWLLARLPCTWEQTSAGGELQGWRLEELPLPAVGDESFAIRLSMDSWSQGIEQVVIFLRRGIAFSFVEITGWLEAGETPDPALVDLIARRVDERLIQLLDTP